MRRHSFVSASRFFKEYVSQRAVPAEVPLHGAPAEGRTLQPGHENDFHAWVQRAHLRRERVPGHQGVTILTLGKEQSQARSVIHRFADEAAERACFMRSTAEMRLKFYGSDGKSDSTINSL
jgi:hypothetical protein